MSPITPTYLYCDENGSDKWYVVAVLDTAQNVALTGYGPNTGGASGTWKQVAVDQAQRTLNEKLRKGYRGITPRLLNAPVPHHLARQTQKTLRKMGGSYANLSVRADADGALQIRTPNATQPAAKPKRRGARHNVWI